MKPANEYRTANDARVVSLDELFPSALRTSGDTISVSACCSDWRQIQEGDVYVALPEVPDAQEDGHLHAQRAVSCGAVAVVCEQPVPVFDVPTYLVDDSRQAFGELCQALVGHPFQNVKTIAVTGAHGKSTTLTLLESIFRKAGIDCGMLSSFGCYDGMTTSAGLSNSPSPPCLAERLARMEAGGCTHALVEVSSRALSQLRFAGMEFDGICVTNVTSAHLDLHNSVQAYRDHQRRVLDHASPGAVVILNADDPVSMKWLDKVEGPVLTYGTGTQAEISAQLIEQNASELTFLLTAGSETAAVRTKVIGEHHISNCLAAATLSLCYGIDLKTIVSGLEAVTEISGCMEKVDCGQGFPVYVDAAEDAESLSASLRTANQLATERVICVIDNSNIQGQGSKEVGIAKVLERMSDLAIVACPLPGPSGERRRLAHVEVIADRSEAIACAVSLAEPGDVVVIAGRKLPPSAIFGMSNQEETDAELARQLLLARAEFTLRVAA